jgi:hypothetical protein
MANGEHRLKIVSVGSMVLLYSAQSLLITASQKTGGGYSYKPNSAVLMTELAKFVVASSLLALDRYRGNEPRITLQPGDIVRSLPCWEWHHLTAKCRQICDPCRTLRCAQQLGLPRAGGARPSDVPAPQQHQDSFHRDPDASLPWEGSMNCNSSRGMAPCSPTNPFSGHGRLIRSRFQGSHTTPVARHCAAHHRASRSVDKGIRLPFRSPQLHPITPHRSSPSPAGRWVQCQQPAAASFTACSSWCAAVDLTPPLNLLP